MNEQEEPAFPWQETDRNGNPQTNHSGMTLRDYFAAKAMHALIVDPVFTREVQAKRLPIGETVANSAYAMADAMLKARTA